MIYAHDWKILGDRRVEHWSDGKRWKGARTLSVCEKHKEVGVK